jgi:hypothetical protein
MFILVIARPLGRFNSTACAKPFTLCAIINQSFQVQTTNYYKSILLIFLLLFYFNGDAQIPSTKETIQNFIDSIGKNNDRQVTTGSVFPSFANGKNFKWSINIWRNSKEELLWVETIIPDSLSTAFFYCQDTLIFAGELSYIMDTISHRQKPLFRNIFFYQSRIIDDSAPERNNNNADHYITESRNYLELSKKENLNMGIIELLNRGVIPDSKRDSRPKQ